MQSGSADEALFREVNRNVALLKEFQAWLNGRGIRATFTTPEDLRRCVAEALHDWRRRHPDREPAQPPTPRPADPSGYLRDLLDKTAHIDIRGLSVGTGQAHRFPIEQLFISLTTTPVPGQPATTSTGRRGQHRDREAEIGLEERHASVPLHEAMQNDRLIVVGDPGSGKTTFVRRVAHALCETELGHVPQAARERLGIRDRTFPVLVRLSDLAQHLAKLEHAVPPPGTPDAPAWLPHYLGAASDDNGWSLGPDFFRQQLEAGLCTVLLDGLDEAPQRMVRERISRLIQNAARSYGRCRFVVTSRPAAYTGETVLPGFAHANISPLEDETVTRFLTGWCAALCGEGSDAAREHLSELLEAVRGEEPIDETRANYTTKPGHPTPVGIYPLGNTPDGICDMAGNVWEWCADGFAEYTGTPQSNPHAASEASRRVFRGGSWAGGAGSSRSACRSASEPEYRHDSLGFRVAAVPLSPVPRVDPWSGG